MTDRKLTVPDVQAPTGIQPRRKRILAVASGGGHWIELIRLAPAFESHDVVWVTVHEAYRADVGPARFYAIHDVTRWNRLRWVRTVFELLRIMRAEKPEVVVSTGALPGFFAVWLGKRLGARTVWLDSIANVERLSLSGRMVRRHADLWLTQWPHLAGENGPSYRGTVL